MAKTITKAATTAAVQPHEEAHKALAYRAAAESIVLLENDGVLPLKPGKVALFGAGAELTVKGGTGSGEVNERHSVSIAEGLEKAGFTITSKPWLKAYRRRCREAKEAHIRRFQSRLWRLQVEELINLMQDPFCNPVGQAISAEDVNADTCIYVVARQAGEGSDRRREDYCLTAEEEAQITFCAEHFPKFILVLNAGAPMALDILEETVGVNAVVFFAQQGGMGGAALADLLTGKVTPSGRLTDTWPMHYEDLPFANEYSYLNGQLNEEYYKEDIYVGYRYFDTFGVKPRYPFGYGLSYTQFAKRFLCLTEGLQMTVEVTNTGDRPGQEVVQLYARCPGKLPKERRRLVAFAKTGVLLPGEKETVPLAFTPFDLASYRETDDTTLLEAGDYVLCLDGTPVAALRVEKQQLLARHKRLCAPIAEWEKLSAEVKTEPHDLPVTVLPPQQTVEHRYDEPKPKSLQLNAKQQAQLCVGGGMFSFRHYDAPGAAGVTTGALLAAGVPQAVLADGPAGLRLAQRSVQLKNGSVKPVELPMEAMNYLPKLVKGFLRGDPNKGQPLYQFTTAFPVGTALAQTWNNALLQQVGEAVGREMERYGVRYWLAPALNIHRNVLCGRNYEYFSEDPLLSGKVAAAMTRGVQSVPGRFVTLKHFACNNQEDHRNHTNANVSVRALREIYLRGFEIAVREGGAETVMSSYNRLNGVYTANSHDLLTKLLRCEWGFDGFVMTDWMSTGKGLAEVPGCIAAGNDLIMPGSGGDTAALLRALKKGHITDVQLHRCAANILHSLKK